jgi:hypothetical protein
LQAALTLRENEIELTCMSWFRKLFGSSASHSTTLGVSQDVPLKTVSYRGGVVTFRIPADWDEEYEPDGGGTFYDKAPDSGTFRLDIITAESPEPVTVESAPEVLSSLGGAAPGNVERLPNGCALVRYTERATENGERLFITFWSVAHVIPPRHARVATFSFTLLDRQRKDPRFQQQVELLDREIWACVFAAELGEMSA